MMNYVYMNGLLVGVSFEMNTNLEIKKYFMDSTHHDC